MSLFPTKRDSELSNRRVSGSTTNNGLLAARRLADRAWVSLGGNHLMHPSTIGVGVHDCALASLYWAAPWIPESRIIEAFQYCAENWPFGGITNKEFAIALKYLDVESGYSDETQTLGALIARSPGRCVVLLHGHFIAIAKGKIVGRDAVRAWDARLTVHCHWTLRR